MTYVPTREHWRASSPSELGLVPEALASAIEYHVAHETPGRATSSRRPGATSAWPTSRRRRTTCSVPSPARGTERGGAAPRLHRRGVGRHRARGHDVQRSKSYLAIVAGLAVDRGLIRSVDDPVRDYVDDGGFDSAHNRAITWRHLLQQTSEWEGTLWGKPDHRPQPGVGESERAAAPKGSRGRSPPGTHWEYNDVRVNRLALALLRCFRRPLAGGAARGDHGSARRPPRRGSGTRTATRRSTIDGRSDAVGAAAARTGAAGCGSAPATTRASGTCSTAAAGGVTAGCSPSGGSTCDAPCAVNPSYGCLWWLNTGRGHLPSAPETSYFAPGAGRTSVWVDPEHDLVAVVRWIDKPHVEPFLRLVVEAIRT